MSILVVCPGCRKSFKVSDKFAGKSGNCPNCKHAIKVPTKQEEVVVHEPEQFASGGKSVTGQLVTKPVAKQMAKFDPTVATMVGGAVLLAFAVAWIGGLAGLFQNVFVGAIALLLLSPPLTWSGYWFLRDDELEPYRSRELYTRCGICALAYALLWGVFGYLSEPSVGLMTGELWNWAFVIPPFVVVGALAAHASLDLEFGTAGLHFSFYVVVTLALRRAAGVPWPWELPGPPLA